MHGQVTVSGITQFPSAQCVAAGIKAHPDNTDTIWIGSSTVSGTTGYPLNAGEQVTIILDIGNLNTLYAISDVENEKACWIKVDA